MLGIKLHGKMLRPGGVLKGDSKSSHKNSEHVGFCIYCMLLSRGDYCWFKVWLKLFIFSCYSC